MQVAQNNLAPPRPKVVKGFDPSNQQQAADPMDFKSMFGQNMLQGPNSGFGELSLMAKREPKDFDRKSMELADNRGNSRTINNREARSSDRLESKNQSEKARSSEEKMTEGKKGLTKSKDSNRRNGVVQKFMDSLESELGITAERFSAALAQLPPEIKAMPIQQSAPYVIAELGINPANQGAATDAYVNLLQNSGINGGSFQGENSLASASEDGLLDFKALGIDQSIKDADRQKLNAAIDDLNRRFFETGKTVDLNANKDFGASVNNDLAQMKSDLKNSSDLARMSGEDELSLSDLEAMALSEGEDVGFQVESKSDSAPKMWSVEELPFLVKNSGSEDQSLENSFGQGSENQDFNSNNLTAQSTKGDRSENLVIDDSQAADPYAQFFGAANAGKNPALKNQAIAKGTGNPAPLNNEQRIANFNKVSAATESLVKRGGGELKVLLTPEGLGNVQLKVKMQDGKLHVEMKADNKESKQLLESSLHELKNHLSSQRISVDSVKVDVASDFNRQDSNPSFTQQQFDLGRDQARQFMNQFREGNLSQRQAFFDAPGFKTYRSQREEPLAPISSEIRPRGSLNSSKGNGINLVA